MNRLSKAIAVISFLAILPLPYSFYMALRVIVFCYCIYGLFQKDLPDSFKAGFVIFGLLFNPIAPLHLFKLLWVPLNIGLGLFAWKVGAIDLEERTDNYTQ
jgi:hypothetical protein